MTERASIADLARAAWLLGPKEGGGTIQPFYGGAQLIPWNHHLALEDDVLALPGRLNALAVVLRVRPEAEVVAENMRLALQATNGHVTKAAGLLGISPKTLYLRLNGDVRPNLGVRRKDSSVTEPAGRDSSPVPPSVVTVPAESDACGGRSGCTASNAVADAGHQPAASLSFRAEGAAS